MEGADRTLARADENPGLDRKARRDLAEKPRDVAPVAGCGAKVLRKIVPLIRRRVEQDDERLVVQPMASRADQEVAAQLEARLAVLLAQLEDPGWPGKSAMPCLKPLADGRRMTSPAML